MGACEGSRDAVDGVVVYGGCGSVYGICSGWEAVVEAYGSREVRGERYLDHDGLGFWCFGGLRCWRLG